MNPSLSLSQWRSTPLSSGRGFAVVVLFWKFEDWSLVTVALGPPTGSSCLQCHLSFVTWRNTLETIIVYLICWSWPKNLFWYLFFVVEFNSLICSFYINFPAFLNFTLSCFLPWITMFPFTSAKNCKPHSGLNLLHCNLVCLLCLDMQGLHIVFLWLFSHCISNFLFDSTVI